ncbi:cytochrome P450 [Streptomyces sp. NPDC059373]
MYFGGDDQDADAAVAWLLPRMLQPRMLQPEPSDAQLELAANRIGLLLQACDATAGLVDRTRRAADGRPATLPTEALLAETLRHGPPVPALRRVAVRDTRLAGTEIAEGDVVVLDVAVANRDPEVFADAGTFDPERSGPPPLTFGSRPRLCPGREHALALAAGILDRAATNRTPAPAEAVLGRRRRRGAATAALRPQRQGGNEALPSAARFQGAETIVKPR